jgi:hypothetical protein
MEDGNKFTCASYWKDIKAQSRQTSASSLHCIKKFRKEIVHSG